MRFPVLCGCAWAILAAQLSAELINGIEFPSGASSFADSLWRFDPEFSGGEAPRMWEPWNILGPPTPLVTQSIGEGGLIELRFDNNVLTTDGTSHPDLYVGEGAGTPEFVFVAIRPTPEALPHFNPQWDANQDGYFELGRFRGEVNREIFGSYILIDLDLVFPDLASEYFQFDAVQLLDDPLDVIGSRYTAGYDLLAVSAISSAGREFSVQPGDVDLDGDVDLADLNLVRNNFGATVEATLPLPGDVYPYDNRVDVRDLNDVRNHFGESLSTVPEPSSVGLALFCALSATLFALSSRLRTHGMS